MIFLKFYSDAKIYKNIISYKPNGDRKNQKLLIMIFPQVYGFEIFIKVEV